jgi:hypothetical protein
MAPYQGFAMLASQLEMFGENMRLLLGIVLFLILGFGSLIAVWTGLKIYFFRRDQRRAAEQFKRSNTGRDGRFLPPVGSGLCDKCGKAGDRVYFLPEGGRRCEACHKAENTPA